MQAWIKCLTLELVAIYYCQLEESSGRSTHLSGYCGKVRTVLSFGLWKDVWSVGKTHGGFVCLMSLQEASHLYVSPFWFHYLEEWCLSVLMCLPFIHSDLPGAQLSFESHWIQDDPSSSMLASIRMVPSSVIATCGGAMRTSFVAEFIFAA